MIVMDQYSRQYVVDILNRLGYRERAPRWLRLAGAQPFWVRDGELAYLTSPLDYPPRQSASRAASRSASSGTTCPEWRHIARFSNPADHLD